MSTIAGQELPDAHLISAVKQVENTICITITGQLDVVVEDELTEVVSAAASTPDVVAMHFDLTPITFIDSSGLRGLIRSSQLALDNELTFTVDVTDDGPVARLLDLTGLRGHFTQATLATPA
jgi:anti-anti-sigma factor